MFADYLSFLIMVPLAIVSWRLMASLLSRRFPSVSHVLVSIT